MASVSEKSILIAGLVRNCGAGLAAEVDRLGRSFAGFGRVRWLVVESDSSDDTRAVLQRLERSVPGFRAISLGDLRHELPLRTQRIARCRNEYLQQLETDPQYADVEYVVMADLDGINTMLTPEALASCWDRLGWAVCAANQRGPYYDIWALRHPLWSPVDCWAQNQFLLSVGVSPSEAFRSAVQSKMLVIAEDGPWIEVDSAFGGLAIYGRMALNGMRYAGLDEAGREVCEHVEFHRLLRERGHRIFINPRLLNAAYTEHTRRLLPSERLKKAARTGLRDLLGLLVGPKGMEQLRQWRGGRHR
jgi:hypothetical protein